MENNNFFNVNGNNSQWSSNRVQSVKYAGNSYVFTALLKNVYLWMALALLITAVTSVFVVSHPAIIQAIITNKLLFSGMIIAELVLVVLLSAKIWQMTFINAFMSFLTYSLLNGLTLSTIFLVYTQSSIATVFFVSAGMFAVMSVIGFVTKKDLSSWGRILLMALIGIIIASVVNIFVASSRLDWMISYVGVLLFSGLTVYDTQKIKHMLMSYGTDISDQTKKIALLGSLNLYLDFINLFLSLLRIFGNRS